jgi:hypothetical protein
MTADMRLYSFLGKIKHAFGCRIWRPTISIFDKEYSYAQRSFLYTTILDQWLLTVICRCSSLEIRKAVKKIFILGCCKCSKSYAVVEIWFVEMLFRINYWWHLVLLSNYNEQIGTSSNAWEELGLNRGWGTAILPELSRGFPQSLQPLLKFGLYHLVPHFPLSLPSTTHCHPVIRRDKVWTTNRVFK